MTLDIHKVFVHPKPNLRRALHIRQALIFLEEVLSNHRWVTKVKQPEYFQKYVIWVPSNIRRITKLIQMSTGLYSSKKWEDCDLTGFMYLSPSSRVPKPNQ